MEYLKGIICNPPDDINNRFLLGKKGSNEMLAIGLNPSSANEDNLDPTSRNIQAIAQYNGCDVWWLIKSYAYVICSFITSFPSYKFISFIGRSSD